MTGAASSAPPVKTSSAPSLPPSPESSAIESLKRHANTLSDYDFFAPAASSFQPRPYTPHSHLSDSRIKPFQYSRNQNRYHDALVVPAGMDPHPSDPNVIFIHPPFTTFPNSDHHPDGLTFQVLTDNSEWFLDPKDFIHDNNTNSHAIAYPPILEPPRGWCPAKKKDLKGKIAEGWIKGEEPRLRCTFCRRQYAGVNAKSMWRRHVFEKHKIAMANRRDRDGPDRPRGRSSNKENKQASGRGREDGHDTLVNLKFEITPGTVPQKAAQKSKFRSSISTPPSVDVNEESAKDKISSSSLRPETNAPFCNRHPSTGPSMTPPLTPHSSSDAGNFSTEKVPPTPPISVPLVPPSPYDPLLTPSFRHSPPPLPSDQPWRFPSPSHPLHSQTRELSLSMLVRNAASPLVKGSPILGSSPLIYSSSSTSSTSRFVRPETPLSSMRLALSSSNHARFSKSRIGSSPLANRPEFTRLRHRIEESPLGRDPDRSKKRLTSELADDWFSGSSLLSGQLNDPFHSIFSSGGAERPSPVKRALEAESPVLRIRNSAETKGLGIGLLEPFDLARKVTSDDEGDNIYADSSSSFGDTEDLNNKYPDDLAHKHDPQQSPSEPPSKKRRLSLRD